MHFVREAIIEDAALNQHVYLPMTAYLIELDNLYYPACSTGITCNNFTIN